MSFDLRTREWLRNACREAERHLDQESIARNADFLEKVSKTPEVKRDSEEFLRLVWLENPLVEIDTDDAFDVTNALAAPDFRRRFLELTTAPLPEDSAERARQLDNAYNEMKKDIRPHMPPVGPTNKRSAPAHKMTRVFATLFPNDFTTLVKPPDRKALLQSMEERPWSENNPARANREIILRLDEALGTADRSDWNAVAQRMMLPEVISASFCNKAHRTPLPVPTVSRCRRLTCDRWTESRSSSSRSATTANWCSMPKW